MCLPAPADGMRARPLVPSRALAALADATGDPLDDLEETALPGAAVLTYDSSNAVGNFCFEVSLGYRRVERPGRVAEEACHVE